MIVTDPILIKDPITMIEQITILPETIIKIDPDMTNTIETLHITVIPDLTQETTPILVIDLKVTALEITLTPLEITNIPTVVLPNQDNIIDPDIIAQIQTPDLIINPLSIMLNLLLILLILKLKIIHHSKLI